MWFEASSDLSSGELAFSTWYCRYSDWERRAGYQVPTRLVEGVRQGPLREDRLEVRLATLEHVREGS